MFDKTKRQYVKINQTRFVLINCFFSLFFDFFLIFFDFFFLNFFFLRSYNAYLLVYEHADADQRREYLRYSYFFFFLFLFSKLFFANRNHKSRNQLLSSLRLAIFLFSLSNFINLLIFFFQWEQD